MFQLPVIEGLLDRRILLNYHFDLEFLREFLPLSLYHGLFFNGALVGASFGKQETSERYYMVNTAILPEHQNRGVYSSFLLALLDRIEAEGFQIVYSRHRASHNAVIIPKLKAGFQNV